MMTTEGPNAPPPQEGTPAPEEFMSSPIDEQPNDAINPFNLVCENLAKIGALSLDSFLEDPWGRPHHAKLPPRSNSPVGAVQETAVYPQATPETSATFRPLSAVQIVHQACQRTFGKVDGLKYDYVEDDPKSKQCILTIIRPNGSTRSYKTSPSFIRKADAKLQAATTAIEMGVLEFIATGDSDKLKAKKGTLLAPVGGVDPMDTEGGGGEGRSANFWEDDQVVKDIEDCCVKWRAGKVRPHWIAFNDNKIGSKCGAALRIALAPHAFRVYSVDATHNSLKDARAACGKRAIDDGIIEYIQHGNGQTEPALRDPDFDQTIEDVNTITVPSSLMTLQEFYESLPQPFPEPVGEMTASEINAASWLNMMIQTARGCQLRSSFVYISKHLVGLHGCLLRLERPTESKSYLVDCRFPKRADAKAAVCLLAMAQGIGDYIRALSKNKFPPDGRKLAEKVIPLLARECRRVRAGNQPGYTFEHDKDDPAFSCTLRVDVSPSPLHPDIREYKVPPEHRTKADAKAAVTFLAVEQGLIELLRFHGAPPPPGYTYAWELLGGAGEDIEGSLGTFKRKDHEVESVEGRERKKRRKGSGDGNGNAGVNGDGDSEIELGEIVGEEEEEEEEKREEHALPEKPSPSYGSSTSNGFRKTPHASGSGVRVSSGSPEASNYSRGQPRPSNRKVSNSVPRYNGPSKYPNDYPRPVPPENPNYAYPHPADRHAGYGSPPSAPYPPAPPMPDPYHAGYPPNYNPPIHDPYASHQYFQPGPQYMPPMTPHVHHYHQPYYSPPPVAQMPYGQYSPPPPPPQYTSQYPHMVFPAPYPHPHPHMTYQQPAPHLAGMHPIAYPPGYASPYVHREPQFADMSHDAYMSSPRSPYHPGQWSSPSRILSPNSEASSSYQREDEGNPSNEKTAFARRNQGSDRQMSSPPKKEISQKEEENLILVNLKLEEDAGLLDVDGPEGENKDKAAAMGHTSNIAALLAFCFRQNIPQPQFLDQTVDDGSGPTKYDVWVVHRGERLELPMTFPSVSNGRERLANLVLRRLRGRVGKN